MRKAISTLYILVFTLVLIQIWIEDSQALLESYGLIAAEIAIALQDRILYKMLQEVQSSGNIKIASESLDIINFFEDALRREKP